MSECWEHTWSVWSSLVFCILRDQIVSIVIDLVTQIDENNEALWVYPRMSNKAGVSGSETKQTLVSDKLF